MIDYEFNRRIMQLAPQHTVSDTAPGTYPDLVSNSGRLVVWSGASDKTIYGDARVNYAFRAWHDSLHIRHNQDFSLDGERTIAYIQASLIGNDQWARIILAEVLGQTEYYNQHGHFPIDQVEFVLNRLKKGI